MQAIILAAGLGMRIQSVTNSIPKCLLEVKGKAIIQYQLEALHNCGISNIVIVVGHLKEKIMALLGDNVRYIENPIYQKSNSSYSLWLAGNVISSDFVYLNSDLIFNEAILRKVLEDSSENTIAVDRTKIKFEDDMFKVTLKDGFVVELKKRLDFQKISAVAPGPVKFSRAGKEILFKALDKIIQRGDRTQWCYSIFGQIAKNIQLKGVDVSGLAWTEVDTAEDLEKARQTKFN